MQRKLNARSYTSVATFSAELSSVLRTVSIQAAADDTAENTKYFQEVSKVAKRILHQTNAGGMLREAVRNEADLARKSHEHELQQLELYLNPDLSGQGNVDAEGDVEVVENVDAMKTEDTADHSLTNGDVSHSTSTTPQKGGSKAQVNGRGGHKSAPNGLKRSRRVPGSTGSRSEATASPQTPSSTDLLAPLRKGGIPWYFERFDPVGTTIHDERWDGAARAMSAELSELDEEELTELGIDMAPEKAAQVPAKKAVSNKKRKRHR